MIHKQTEFVCWAFGTLWAWYKEKKEGMKWEYHIKKEPGFYDAEVWTALSKKSSMVKYQITACHCFEKPFDAEMLWGGVVLTWTDQFFTLREAKAACAKKEEELKP
jgi:hypothetical protein